MALKSTLFELAALLLLALFCLFLGPLLLSVPLSSPLREATVSFLQHSTWTIVCIGAVFVVMGIGCIAVLYARLGSRIYTVRSGDRSITLNEELIEAFLQAFWHEQYPFNSVNSRVAIAGQTLYIWATLPPTTVEARKDTLAEVEKTLDKALRDNMGFSGAFRLIATFEKLAVSRS